ncbi:MAG: efflux RND transporter periplasmic adaptor subunit [Cytophagaceae bacterium]|nr:efflux RND transporter periplasmic adaptor subunit [Gemmatimonadaceae bacterium]
MIADRHRFLAVLGFLAVVGGCARDEGEASPARTKGGGQGGRNDRVTPVEVMVAKRGRVERSTTLAGTIEPVRVVGVNAQLSGALANVRVREGTAVREGDLLAQVDARELEAQVRSAEANLAFAQSTARRSEQLNTERIITAAEYERDRAALSAAEATLEQLKTRVGFAAIRAPIAGMITERLVEAGDIVSNNQRLFTVAEISTLVTRVLVSELEVGALRAGHAVQVSVDALPGEHFTGRIRRVFPSADSATRMVPVEVELNRDARGRLKPGFTARSTFQLDVRDDAVLLPTRAVLGSSGARNVFIFKAGHAERRAVRVGLETSGNIEILDGVQVGDTVIVTGANDVQEGSEVRIVEPLAPDVPGAAVPRAAPALESVPGPVPKRP